MKKLFGLGKGLGSLIPAKNEIKAGPKNQDNVFYVEINKIRPNPNQPRRILGKEGLEELAASIRKYGILQPLLVSKVEIEKDRGLDVQYELIAGERRWRAAQLANLPHVPVIVKNNFDEKRVRLEVALVENVQREDLTPLEEADAYQKLNKEFGMTHNQIAEKVGKDRTFVTNTLRLLALPPDMKEALRSGKISRSHGRALLGFKDKARQKEVFRLIMTGNVASNEVETVAKEHGITKKKSFSLNPHFSELEQNLAKNLGTAVLISSGPLGGKIVIKFGNLEELNKIAKTILD